MLAATAELLSGAVSYLRRLLMMIFRPGLLGRQIRDEVGGRIKGTETRYHAARFFYSTMGVIVFASFIGSAMLGAGWQPIGESQMLQALYFVAAILIAEVLSLITLTRESARRKIYAAIVIHGVAAWSVVASIGMTIVGVTFLALGWLAAEPEFALILVSLSGLLIASIVNFVFVYRATREALEWKVSASLFQAFVFVVVSLIVLTVLGSFLPSVTTGLAAAEA